MTPDPMFDQRELVAIERDECLRLLRIETVGRLAYLRPPATAPEVVPVNFILDGEEPIFRTHHGAALDDLVGHPVSLQIDRFDWAHHAGWSVLVQGTCELVSSGDAERLELESWAPGPQPVLVRIVGGAAAGRRIELHQRPLSADGYL